MAVRELLPRPEVFAAAAKDVNRKLGKSAR